ncbi:MAG: ATP-dependent helicase, partial [bacterium]
MNPQQTEAVTYGEGPLLILAGAGSGKTKVLACRAAFLVHQGWARPYQILALTFTNKAANELKRRIVHMVGGEGELVVAGTFHSIFSRILRMEGREVGVNPSFTILDEEDRLKLIKQIVKDLKLETKFPRANEVVSQISRAKNNLIDVTKFIVDASDPTEEWVGMVYGEYEKRKGRMEALDFDDLLMMPAQMFDKNPSFLQRCQERFRWVMVDEFQDTNYVQYFLIQQISKNHRNINVVGDDDQAIYGWRGATVANILNFPKDWTGTKIVRLEQNYRSPKIVLDIAWSVISRNPYRHPKRLWSTRSDNFPVYLFEAATDEEEARLFVTFIQDKIKSEGYSYGDFAILYRINAQSLPFERTLRAVGIPYQLVGGLRFYERKEIKDLLAYLRLVINPDDDVAFLRVINYPPRGLGDKVLEALSRISRENGIS